MARYARWTRYVVVVLMLSQGALIGWTAINGRRGLVAINVALLCVNCWSFSALSTLLRNGTRNA